MNHVLPSQCTLRPCLALGLALGLWLTLPAQSAEPADGKMMAQCREMKAQKHKVQVDMDAQAKLLAAKLETMNRAPREEKLELMSAVVTDLVEQQTAMNARKAKLDEDMMKHMMEHMQTGKESMAQCAMMKGMDTKPGDAHKDHQPKQK
jgi:hypothetical protein